MTTAGNQGQNVYPSPENYPASSFPQPVPAPTTEPDDAGTLLTVQYSWDWRPVLMGAVDQLLNPATWQGDHDTVIAALNRAANLKDLLAGTISSAPTPYWEDEDASDADDQKPETIQEWYGYMEGDTFVDTLGGWIFLGQVALVYGVDGAIEFATFLHNFRLFFKTGPGGAIIDIFVDALKTGRVDTYSALDGFKYIDVYSPGSTLRIVNTGTGNPLSTPTPDGYAMAVIRKRLSQEEIYPANQRYNPDTDTVQFSPDGGTTWVDTPDLDPRHSNAMRFPARTGGTAQCDAAANMVKWIHDFIDATVAALLLAAEVFQIVNLALEFFDLIFAVPAIVDLLLEFADIAVGVGGFALDGAFSSTVYDALLCIFFCDIGSDGQVSAAQLATIESDIEASSDINTTARLVLDAIFAAQGEVGLSNAGTKTLVSGDCSTCECQWCARVDFRTAMHDWNILNDGTANARGMWVSGQGVITTGTGDAPLEVYVYRTFVATDFRRMVIRGHQFVTGSPNGTVDFLIGGTVVSHQPFIPPSIADWEIIAAGVLDGIDQINIFVDLPGGGGFVEFEFHGLGDPPGWADPC